MLNSLFTDRQARADDVIPDGSDDPRGWWRDTDPLHPIPMRYEAS
ncbi:phage GP46 family protein [Caballeronia sordidicola]|nr:phage GP46 family protein [Caballeronia sordidicola]